MLRPKATTPWAILAIAVAALTWVAHPSQAAPSAVTSPAEAHPFAQASSVPFLAEAFASTAGRVQHMAIADDVAWLAQQHILTAIDLSASPSAILSRELRFASRVLPSIPTYIRAVAAAPGGLVLVGVEGSLHVIDGSDPKAPTTRATIALADGIADVVVRDTVAYVLVFGPGDDPSNVMDVMVVDLADPSAPRIVREHILRAGAITAGRLEVAGDVLAWFGTPVSIPGGTVVNVRLFDLADPLQPRSALRREVSFRATGTVGLRDGRPTLVLADDEGLVVLDVSKPADPQETLRLDESYLPRDAGGTVEDVTITAEGWIYATAPRQLASFYTAGQVFRVGEAGGGPWGYTAPQAFVGAMTAHGRRLLLVEKTGISVHDPNELELSVWPMVTDSVGIAALSADGRDEPPRVLSAAPVGAIFELAQDDSDVLLHRSTVRDWTQRGRLSADDGWLVATNFGQTDLHRQSLDIFEAGPNGLTARGTIDLLGDASYFAHQGQWLIAPDGRGSLDLHDIAAAGGPARVAEAPITGVSGGAIAMDGANVAVVGYESPAPRPGNHGAARIHTYRAEGLDSATPRLEQRGSLIVETMALAGWSLPQVAMEGNVAFVILHGGCIDARRTELHVVDLSDPDVPRSIAVLELPDSAHAPVVERGILLLAGEGVLAVDVRQPATPRILGRLTARNQTVVAVDAADGIVFAGSRAAGIAVHAFAPNLPWRGAAGVPSPTPPPSSTPGPSPSPMPRLPCPPTPTRLPSPTRPPITAVPTVPTVPTATASPPGMTTQTPTPTPSLTPVTSMLYLPWTERTLTP